MILLEDQFIKNLWLWAAGVEEKSIHQKAPKLKDIYSENWSSEFEQLMRNRLAMGYFRYGPLKEQKKGAYDVLGSIEKRLAKYRQCGNDELLVDCANLCMVEYMKGVHPNKHFASEDDSDHVELKK